MPAGRPKKTIEDTAPNDWKEQILELAKNGKSDVQVRAHLGITTRIWYNWIKESEEFRETISEAKSLCEAYWVDKGEKMMESGKGIANIWIFNMKNRFGWKDRQDITSDDKSIIPIQWVDE